MASTPKKRRASDTAKRPAAAPAASRTATLPKPAPAAAPAPAKAPVPAARPNPWVLLALGAVAVLVVFEMTVLVKGKADRQRTLQELGTFGERGGAERPGAFHGPILIKVDAQERLLMVDIDWRKVLAWEAQSGKFLFECGPAAAKETGFQPSDVGTDAQGTLYVLDRLRQEVRVFSPTGEWVRTWAAPSATALAVTPKGQVLTSDSVRKQVVQYSPEGQELKRFGGPGTGKGRFGQPYRLDTDANGNIYVLDTGNQCVQVLSPNGSAVRMWNLKYKPAILSGIVVRNQEVFLNDYENNFIWIYSTSGALAGQISNPYPSTMAVDRAGQVYLPGPAGITRYLQVKGGKKK